MRRALLTTTLALTLLGSAHAGGSLTCSSLPLAFQVGCFVEVPAFTISPVEFSVGIDASIDTRADELVSLAPYGILAAYQDGWSAWLELRMPQLLPSIPILGSPDPIRLGFNLNW